MTDRTWKIRDWNCEMQKFDAERTVTLAQFKAEVATRSAVAMEIHKANVAALAR